MCKKTISAFLASALALSLLAGCGGGDSSSAAASSAGTSAAAPSAEPTTAAVSTAPASTPEESVLEDSAAETETTLNEAPEPEDYTLSEDGETLSLWYPAAGAFQNMIDYNDQARLKETETGLRAIE